MNKIAVIGMSCLFPGAHTPDQFWDNLMEQKDSRSQATREDMEADVLAYYHPRKGSGDKFYSRLGGYIRDFEMDPSGFELPSDYVQGLDNVATWSLYVAREALKDSGYWGRARALARCGLILGNLSFPTRSSNHLFLPIYREAVEGPLRALLEDDGFQLAPFAPPRTPPPEAARISGFPAAVVAAALSLSPAFFSIDAACASSLYSVKLACDYLHANKADLMLAGAVNATDPFFIQMGFSVFQALPEAGAPSSPLDTNTAGLVPGEGAGMLVLKRYDDAVRDGDRIHAVIVGAGLANDGRGQSVLSPNPKGQILAFERAYADAGIDPRSVSYVECHATGTALGDKVELNSMDAFFGKHGASPLVGSVKSNLGHLLTASGMPSMLKVILSMAHGVIPATINLRQLQTSANHVIGTPQIVTSSLPWPGNSALKRAAVNAFGLGGTDAHIIFERHDGPATAGVPRARQPALGAAPPAGLRPDAMAIVGMDAHFGACDGLAEFQRTIYAGIQHFVPVPAMRWKGIEDLPALLKRFGFEHGEAPHGAYLGHLDIDFLRFKIPPNEDDRLIPQQLLALKVADNALQDARATPRDDVAVIIAMETELALHLFRGRVNLSTQIPDSLARTTHALSPRQAADLQQLVMNSVHHAVHTNQFTSFIGNIMASRVSSLRDLTGPAFTLSSEETSVFKALEIAHMMLAAGDVQAVVVGAVDLAGGLESVLSRNSRTKVNAGPYTLGFDQHVDGWTVGEGAGAVVLKSLARAIQDGDRIYAKIDAITFASGTSRDSVHEAAQHALAGVGLEPSEVGYLEVFASGIATDDEAEIAGLMQAYRPAGPALRCAIGSAKAHIGHTFAASGMASLIKTALCLHHRYIPGTPGWSAPKLPHLWNDGPFYVPPDSRPWLLDDGHATRVAAISGLGTDGTSSHLLLSEGPGRDRPSNASLASTPPFLFPVAGDDQAALATELAALQRDTRTVPSLFAVAASRLERHPQQARTRYALAIVGRNKDECLTDIAAAQLALERGFADGTDWSSPRGSFLTVNPLGPEGKIAFVYPGGFSSYPGLGRDLFHLFPQLTDGSGAYASRLGHMSGHELLYPRALAAVPDRQLHDLERALLDRPLATFESGILFAILYTQIMRDCFRVEPTIALGYSMGEVSMMFALGACTAYEGFRDAVRASRLFQSRLAGPMETLREAWHLPPASTPPDRIWRSYTLRAAAPDVRQALRGEPRAYLTFVNSPQEVVISGEEQACTRVIQRLDCGYVDLPMSSVIHCEMVRSEYDQLVRLHSLPLQPITDIDFYSAHRSARVPLDSQNFAHNIAAMYCREIDFQRLVEQAYQDGARIFVEVGPQERCTRWITEILGDRSHLAVGANRKGVEDKTSILRALARLYSHRVDLDLSPLSERSGAGAPAHRTLVKSTPLGGDRIASTLLTQENRSRFQRPRLREGSRPPRGPARGEPSRVAAPRLSERQPAPITLAPSRADTVRSTQEPAPPLPGRSTPGTVTGLDRNLSLLGSSHSAFLQARRDALTQIANAIRLHMALAPTLPPSAGTRPGPTSLSTSEYHPSAPSEGAEALPAPPPAAPRVIWDRANLLEFAEGRLSNVFGHDYAVIDTYRRRVRLPTEPYLLVSRVTALDADPRVFRPSSITTEYDIPSGAWYTVDGQAPWAVAVESGQCDLLLIGYMGVDFECKGNRVYRLLDCTLTFLSDLPREGDTLRYHIRIKSFARTGGTLLFFFEYDCFVKDQMILQMRDGCAGFFTDAELQAGKGILPRDEHPEETRQRQQTVFLPPLMCDRSSFHTEDLLHLVRNEPAACFGSAYDQGPLNPSLRVTAEAMLMIDRVSSVDPKGGAWGLGRVVAEKHLSPNHWYFPCHFKDDQVLAGSLMADGCCQLLSFYMLYLGLQLHTRDARFQPIHDLPQRVRCRGQVVPQDTVLTYRMQVKAIGTRPAPYAIADVDILLGTRIVVNFTDVGVAMSEKTQTR